MPKTNSNSHSYELSIVHPATAEWLTAHDYTYEHEVDMPDYGRADFIATHKDGHILIVECKGSGQALSRSITQVRDYREQYNTKAKVAIAMPSISVGEVVLSSCKRRKVDIISLDVQPKSKDKYEPAYREFIRDYIILEKEVVQLRDALNLYAGLAKKQTDTIESLLDTCRKSQDNSDQLMQIVNKLEARLNGQMPLIGGGGNE